MADKEFTQICKEILAASEKISPLAEQAGKLVDRIEQEKSKLQAAISEAKEAIKQALQGANEQATQTLSAAQSQAKQTAKLAKEATEQNAVSAKSAQQKAEEILASIEKLQTQIKATADKVENAGTLLTELNSLKEQIKTLLQSGIINDEAQSATQTYSSNLIERKLETKAGVGYGYSKIEASAKFDALAQSINTAISAAAAAQSSAAGKLGKDEQAADSAKLGGMVASVSETSNTIAQRTAEGDLRARCLRCEYVELQAPTQDSLMGTTSELIFRNTSDKYERATSIVRVLQCLNSVQNDVAWMDSDAITPDNKNQVGFARLPGGLIIQFGMTHRLAAGEARTQIFPIAFPHACFVVLCSPHLPLPDNGLLSPYTQGWGTTTCTVKNVDSDSSCHIAWIAIGN